MKSLSLLFLFFFYVQVYFTQTGEIKGVIVDKETNGPIFGATAKILIDSIFIGDISEFGGDFSIKNIPVGEYLVKINFIGKMPHHIKFKIDSNEILILDTLFLIEGQSFSCGFYIGCPPFYNPIINLEEPQKVDIYPLENRLPGTYAIDIPIIKVKTIRTNRYCPKSNPNYILTTNERLIHIKGSRDNTPHIYLDGLKLNINLPKIPSQYIKDVFIYEGSLPAKYGDTKSDVTIIETKSYFEVLREIKIKKNDN